VKPREYRFQVRHVEKQRLLLRALNDMRIEGETTVQSQAIIGMVHELERLIALRQRHRRLSLEQWRGPRTRVKKSSYAARLRR
jgi:hypothetical protein